MKTGRDKKIAEEIRREVSQIFALELGDPRVHGATVTGVVMTPDLKLARIYFAIPGVGATLPSDEAKEVIEAAERALKKSAGYIRRQLSSRILIKFIPQIEFFYDESLDLEGRMEQLFAQIHHDSRDGEENEKDDGGDPPH
jgi:ribosome-binding factor A